MMKGEYCIYKNKYKKKKEEQEEKMPTTLKGMFRIWKWVAYA